MQSEQSAEWVIIGEIAGAYGVRGEIRVHNYSEAPVVLKGVKTWFLRDKGQWRPYTVSAARLHGQCVVGKLDGIDDRDTAAALRNVQVALRRTDLPPTAADEFYWADLEGMTVVNREQTVLGTVVGLMRMPANDILRVQTPEEKEMLVPFIGSAIDRVDTAARTVYVDWGADWL